MALVKHTLCVTLRKENPNLIGVALETSSTSQNGSLQFLHCHISPDVCVLSIQGPDTLLCVYEITLLKDKQNF